MTSSTSSTSQPGRLLSDNYRQLNRAMHELEMSYGRTARRYVEFVCGIARERRVRHILDYGCGKRELWRALHPEFDVRNFDPALSEFDASPEPADMVVCIDVLEHVEPEFLENVLSDLVRVTIKVGFFTIATRPALKSLPDGTNCHRIVREPTWWLERIRQHWPTAKAYCMDPHNGLQVAIGNRKLTKSLCVYPGKRLRRGIMQHGTAIFLAAKRNQMHIYHFAMALKDVGRPMRPKRRSDEVRRFFLGKTLNSRARQSERIFGRQIG